MNQSDLLIPSDERTLTGQIVRQMRKQIIAGDIPLGARLTEAALTEQFGVSRSTVREAISKLQAEGLVETRAHRGTRVAQFDTADAIEICELHAMLEARSVRRMHLPIDNAQRGYLQRLVEQMGQVRFPADGDRFIDMDHVFHHSVVSAAGQARTLQVWTALNGLLSVLVTLSLGRPLCTETVQQRHQAIIEALRQQDNEHAAAVISEHYLSLARQMGAQSTDDRASVEGIGEPE